MYILHFVCINITVFHFWPHILPLQTFEYSFKSITTTEIQLTQHCHVQPWDLRQWCSLLSWMWKRWQRACHTIVIFKKIRHTIAILKKKVISNRLTDHKSNLLMFKKLILQNYGHIIVILKKKLKHNINFRKIVISKRLTNYKSNIWKFRKVILNFLEITLAFEITKVIS